MKTKLLATLAAALFVCVLGLSACSTTQTESIPPGQILAIACPPVQAAIVQFEALDATLPTVPAAVKAGATLKQIQPTVAAACAAGATVSIANVQAFAQTVLPALGQVAGSLPIPPAQLAQVQAGLVAAEIAVGAIGVVQQQVQAAQNAKAAPAPATSTK